MTDVERPRVPIKAGYFTIPDDPAAIPKLEPLRNDPNSKVADKANRAVERLKRVAPPGRSRS